MKLGLKQRLTTKAYKLKGNTKGIIRNRVLSNSELKTLLNGIQKSKKEARKLGIPDIRFQKSRKIYYNLIRQDRPIYEISELSDHSSATTI